MSNSTSHQHLSSAWRGFVRFRGCSGRREFWTWTLFVAVVSLALCVVMAVLITIKAAAGPDTPDNPLNGLDVVFQVFFFGNALFLLVTLLPTIAMACRRLRDAGCSPWLILLPLIAIVGCGLMMADAALSGMDGSTPALPLWAEVFVVAFTALVLLIFVILFCKPSAPQHKQ